MPVWTVQISGGEHEQVEAWALATEAGALVALGEDGLLVQAWAPGQWRTGSHCRQAAASPLDGSRTPGNGLLGVPSAGLRGSPARPETAASPAESPAGTAAH